jgi:hypothetical protein
LILLITVSGPGQPCDIPNLAAETTCLKDRAWLQAAVLIGSQHQQTASKFKENEVYFQSAPQSLGLDIENAARRALQRQTQLTILPKET